ncbi:DUF3347 domain-containing protein [Kriegella aquimaris]|uniref:DUF3347 domain-containing protein n=1 Tax=Kriegella aquimaris TaxID=192904 RepID=A0A1G9LMN8_9FLAO|nr:DUF3347 domain-containing protein [Kriegella aquimaris]SDL63178.1 Protein of unknown function [Kriegella aquimaris]
MKIQKTNLMNGNKNLALMMAAIISMASCVEKKEKPEVKGDTGTQFEQTKGNSEATSKASFSDSMAEKVFSDYQKIRAALVDSGAGEVQAVAKKLVENFTEEQEGLRSMALAMAATDNLEEQRELFSEMNAIVEPLIKESISEGTIYKQFCPMAFSGKGGYWISNVKEIQNPYYGKKMLKCGKVVEEI